MKTVTVRDLVVGEGAPKIIVSLMGKTITDVKSEALAYREADFDILEWRVDHFANVTTAESVLEAAGAIREIITDKPLLFTFRSAKEGGEQALTTGQYIALNRAAVDSGLVDMIDLELFTGDDEVKATVDYAHQHNVAVIMSNHDFHKTPAAEEIVQRLRKMQELGADIPKIAVMPQTKADVLDLTYRHCRNAGALCGSSDYYHVDVENRVISRLAGEVFGSAATFGAGEKSICAGTNIGSRFCVPY
ncbi:3-dehydroquinate dehydratase [Salmonella enterica subsp. enterica]|uniref:3-dehydroquinate dehydratase n=1 Tax=Salmonella enterica I TaxID=59201 RepID=A0A379VU25_SALET|nr:3-dehydroquinate dehydratase [Salmonella enterica subsp. enterica]